MVNRFLGLLTGYRINRADIVLLPVDREVGGGAELVPAHVLELLVLFTEPEVAVC